jgi:hypothetical protein
MGAVSKLKGLAGLNKRNGKRKMKNIFEMFKQRNKTQTNGTPLPPEPGFYDKPKGLKKAIGITYDLLEKKWVRFVLVVLLIYIVSAVFFKTSKKNARVLPPQSEEKRVLATSQSMDRAIDLSAKGPKSKSEPDPIRPNRSGKRKYGTDIAVFVEKPESLNEGAVSKKDRQPDIKLGIPSGTKIPALLADRVFSFNVAAPVTALVSKDFKFQDKVAIPKDSKFLGEVNVVKSVDRVNVRFDLLILPDGRELRVRAVALSEDGSAGIKGRVDKHTDTKVLKAVGETLLAGASMFVGARSQDPYSLEDQMRVNLAENLANQASQDIRSVKTDKSITVESGVRILVMLLEAV